MRNLIKNIIIILLVFFVISGIVMVYNTPVQKVNNVTLNELANQINDQKVKDIQVEGEKLNITLTDDTKEISRKEAESSLSESLKNYGVDPEKLRSVSDALGPTRKQSGYVFWHVPGPPYSAQGKRQEKNHFRRCGRSGGSQRRAQGNC